MIRNGYTRRNAIWCINDLGYYRFNLDYLGLQQQQKRFNGYRLALHRVAQEALTNIQRHAQAKHAFVSLVSGQQ